MKTSKITIGMKVIPIRKTVYGSCKLRDCEEWNMAKARGQKYLYVNSQIPYLPEDERYAVFALSCNDEGQQYGGDLFHSKDFIPYEGKSFVDILRLIFHI